MMFTVGFEDQLREAFAAGQAAALAVQLAGKHPEFARTPKTYEEWIESISHRPAIVRG